MDLFLSEKVHLLLIMIIKNDDEIVRIATFKHALLIYLKKNKFLNVHMYSSSVIVAALCIALRDEFGANGVTCAEGACLGGRTGWIGQQLGENSPR